MGERCAPRIALPSASPGLGPRSPAPSSPERRHVVAGRGHVVRERNHEPRGRIHEPRGRIHEPRGRIHELRGRIHEPRGRVHEPRGPVHALRGRVHEPRGCIHEPRGPVHELRGRVHGPRGPVPELRGRVHGPRGPVHGLRGRAPEKGEGDRRPGGCPPWHVPCCRMPCPSGGRAGAPDRQTAGSQSACRRRGRDAQGCAWVPPRYVRARPSGSRTNAPRSDPLPAAGRAPPRARTKERRQGWGGR
jgi:hypothetical protein